MGREPRTRTDEIVNRLTQSIITKRLAPGVALDEISLAQDFSVSRTPIREALRQLAASGLVELRPHRAPIVANADDARLSDMFDIMAELEALCASRACQYMSADERHMLESHHHRMGDMMRQADMNAYRQANLVFHAMIYDGAHNSYLRELALGTRERLAPHRGVQLEMPERLATSYAEHGEIVTAVLQGDAIKAALAARQHLDLTRRTLRIMHTEEQIA
ncbi:MAG: GntR family transcriptional regulator [Rhizobiales bacterium PAR1]|nr:MAG: GntR family transcriptional regulator [Rhizobiales bacterium PAR1]